MADELLILNEKPSAKYLIAGWRRQWSDGGDISSGLSRYLINTLGAKKIGEMSPTVSKMCYPFQISGTHDAFRPRAAFQDGLPSSPMTQNNGFYDAGNGLILFRGDEPWYRIDLYGESFFQAITELGIEQTVMVEGYNGPAPPEMERRIGCVYSKAEMKETLEKFGVQFSNYGSLGRQGPTIGMALVTMAHYQYPETEVFRLGAMAPMYPFTTSDKQQAGIATDHRSFYDIMRRLRAMFQIDINLSELESLGNAESRQLQETLDEIGTSDPEAQQIIARVKADYSYARYDEQVDLTPELDQTLRDILDNMPDES
tara:strand:- start:446 stop:1387 length:942 start_codon:yes stop_codon:yes gene_type:complete